MIVFRGTKKALKEMGPPARNAPDPGEGFLGSWFVNVFYVERRKCAVIVNDQTLYCVLLYGLKKKDFQDLRPIFVSALRENMRLDGFPVGSIEWVALEGSSAAVGKTNSKRVLGIMNEMVFTIKYLVAVGRNSPEDEIRVQNRSLNRTPWSGLALFDGVDMFRDLIFGAEDGT